VSIFEDPEIFRSVLENLQTGVYLVDREQKILFWNAGAERITGYLRQDVVGRFCRENLLAHNDEVLSDAADAILPVLRDGKAIAMQLSLRHKEGHRVYVRLRAVAIRNSHGSIIGVAESFEESLSVSNWDRRQVKLSEHGCIDPATGAATTEYTLRQVQDHLARFVDFQIPVSILYVQIDQIDEFRNKYGAAALPAISKAVAQTLGNSLRPTDLVGRISKTHFLALLTECGAAEAEKVAARLKKMVKYAEIDWWGDWLSVTTSFGGATAEEGDTVQSMLARGEAALEECARRGGNCFIVASNCAQQDL
jgi:PAS domain S-box-containing protein/diguanylate cyclase (GGDEF)-like protein